MEVAEGLMEFVSAMVMVMAAGLLTLLTMVVVAEVLMVVVVALRVRLVSLLSIFHFVPTAFALFRVRG